MADRFPDYDVLAKRDTPSWNNQTRAAVDKRLALVEERSVLTDRQLRTLRAVAGRIRSEEHTSELQSLMRISYAVFCLKKKNTTRTTHPTHYAQNQKQSTKLT